MLLLNVLIIVGRENDFSEISTQLINDATINSAFCMKPGAEKIKCDWGVINPKNGYFGFFS